MLGSIESQSWTEVVGCGIGLVKGGGTRGRWLLMEIKSSVPLERVAREGDVVGLDWRIEGQGLGGR